MYAASYVQSQVKAMKGQGVSRADMIRYLAGYCQGWGYVFGAAGEMCTPANRKKYASSRPDHAEAIRGECPVLAGKQPACDGCKRVDTRIFDCRGFTRWLLAQVGVPLFGGTVTAQWEDSKNWVVKGDIKDMPHGLVCCVFRPSHTGMYVGNDTVRLCGGLNVLRDNIDTRTLAVQNSEAIAAGATKPFRIGTAYTGYTPIGIVSIFGSGTTGLVLQEFYLDETEAVIYYRNATSNSITPTLIKATILYRRN